MHTSLRLNFRHSMKATLRSKVKMATGFITTQGSKCMFQTEHFFFFILCLLVSDKKQKYLPKPKKHGYPIWESDSYFHIQEAKILATCMFHSLTTYHGSVEVKSGIKALCPMLKKKNVTGAYPFSKWLNVPLAFHPIGLGVAGISPSETK